MRPSTSQHRSTVAIPMKSDQTKTEKPLRIKLQRAGHKLVRLDRPLVPDAESDQKTEAAEGKGSLIDLLLRAIRTEPANRRQDHRHPAVEQDVWVGWWSGDDFGAIKGRLLNISRGGAQIVVACRPPRKKSVWIYKDIGTTLASIRGEVAGYTPAPEGCYSVRFRFAMPCPTVFCEAVVCRQSPEPGSDG